MFNPQIVDSPTVKAGFQANCHDQFTSILSEANDFFSDQGVHLIQSPGDIYGDDGVFTQYSSKLCEGALSEDVDQIEMLMANHRLQVLKESSIANIEPITTLTMPYIRKLWYKTSIKNVIPTEVAKLPVFGINLLRPYMEDAQGVKHYLPEALNPDNFEDLGGKAKLYDGWIPTEAPTLDTDPLFDFFETDGTFNIMEKSGGSKQLRDTLDSVIKIVSVNVQAPTNMVSAIEKKIILEQNISDGIYGYVDFQDDNGVQYRERIFGTIDRDAGTIAVTSLKGMVKGYKVKGYLSSENNRRSVSVSFDNYHKDVKIKLGEHMNSPLQIEWLQDNMALYNIDAAAEVVDIMSEVFAQKLDYEGFSFLTDAFEENDFKLSTKWSARPASYAATTPTEWKNELKNVIERMATKLKSFYKFNEGSFVVYGNPIDMLLLQDINWSFNHNQSERGGVNVSYDIGAMTVNNSYKLVSVETIPSGYIDMIMVPNKDNYMTFKYFPYTFNVEKGTYRDPNNSLVPAIMMTKRHTFEKLVPINCRIRITNNDESMYDNYS